MGLLDMISSVVRDATPGAIALRTGYLQGQKEEEDRRIALARQAALDQQAAELHASQIGENNARADYYRNPRSQWGQPFSTSQGLYERNAITGEVRPVRDPATEQPPAAGGLLGQIKSQVGGAPSFDPIPTARGIDRALQGGNIADDSETPSTSGGLISSLKQDVSASQGPGATAQQAPGRILQPAPKSEPTVAVLGDDGKPTLVKRSESAGRTPYRPTGNAPHTLVTDQGIMQYDPKTDSWKPTGYTRTPASKESGAGSLADTRSEKYFSTVAKDAIAAADQQIDPGVTGEERARQREQLAIQAILGNPKTADIFTKGMSSRHIQSANQAFGSSSDKQKQGQAKTTYQLGGDASYKPTPSNTPTRTPAPSAAAAHETGNIDLRDEGSLSDADLWEKKVAEGMPKDKATAYVRARSKKTGTP